MLDPIVTAIAALPARDTASVRKLRRRFSRQLANEPADEVLHLVLSLLQRTAVPRFFAYELCANHAGALSLIDARTLLKIAGRLDSWWTVDAFAICIAGPAWRARRIADTIVMRWTQSPDRWWRRAALVSTVPLGPGNTNRTLRICRALCTDRDRMVTKALSWALRVLSKHDPSAVRNSLEAHDR